MGNKFFILISFIVGLSTIRTISAAELPQDLCSYLIDVKAFSRQDCAAFDQNKDQVLYQEAVQKAPARKAQVLLLAKLLAAGPADAQHINSMLSNPQLNFNPSINDRTFPAWLPAEQVPVLQDALSSYAHYLIIEFRDAKMQVDNEMPGANEAAKNYALQQKMSNFFGTINDMADLLHDPAMVASAMDGSRVRPGEPDGVSVVGAGSGQTQTSNLGAADNKTQAATQEPPAPPVVSQPYPAMNWDAVVDKSVNPCVDFYQYACGNWVKKHHIPADQPRWGRLDELTERNLSEMRQILDDASRNPDPTDPDQKKMGDLYSACMDTKTIDAKGISPIEPELERIDAMKSKSDLPAEVAHLHQIGVPAFFGFGPDPDDMNASQQIGVLDPQLDDIPRGYNLPGRDYYLKKDFQVTLASYTLHVEKMFELLGDSSEEAVDEAKAAVSDEKFIAAFSMDRVKRRDPASIYQMESLKDFEKDNKNFNWNAYFSAMKAPPFDSLNIADPEFFKGFNVLMNLEPLDGLKSYLRWQVINAKAAVLPQAFVQEHFNFFGKDLSGQLEITPRWKKCSSMVDDLMGDALGRAYAKKYFPQASKEEALTMVHAEEKSMGEDIQGLSWMSLETKPKALNKLSQMEDKIGYPDKWKDYKNLTVSRGDAFGDLERAAAFASRHEINKIGTQTDKSDWEMTPPTVNAYYEPTQNNINFPAGILQPPLFNKNVCLAQNLGGIGAIIGHEMTHGFDDQGSQYDGQGNRRNWWTKTDTAAFKQRTSCLSNEYSQFTVPNPDKPTKPVHVNGELTLGENTADNGGMRVAYMTLQNKLAHDKSASCGNKNWTDEQIFFLSFAQDWCSQIKPQLAVAYAVSDPHSPNPDRVNGVVQNMPEFAKAFSCKANSPMTPQNACRVW